MSPESEPTVESIKQSALENGFGLTDEEASKLLTGVKRNREMAARVRAVLGGDTEPAPVFTAGSKE